MTRSIVAAAGAALLLSTGTAAMGQALVWRVSETAGDATVRHGERVSALTRGAVLAEGDVVTTGGGARAVLVHDRDFVTVAPNSRVAIPAAAQATGMTKLIQSLGNAVYKIQKLGVPHFGVSTPYLAAVVKGTTFSVTVDAGGTSLQVTEGAVEVATLDGGARDLIRPGAVASIAAGDLYRLRVQGDEERTIDSPSRAPTSTPAPAAPAAPVSATSPAAGAETSVADAAPTPMVAVASAVEVDGAILAGKGQDAPMIREAIASKPTDLGLATNGLLSGAAAPAIAAATVDRVELAAVAHATPATLATLPRPDAAPVRGRGDAGRGSPATPDAAGKGNGDGKASPDGPGANGPAAPKDDGRATPADPTSGDKNVPKDGGKPTPGDPAGTPKEDGKAGPDGPKGDDKGNPKDDGKTNPDKPKGDDKGTPKDDGKANPDNPKGDDKGDPKDGGKLPVDKDGPKNPKVR